MAVYFAYAVPGHDRAALCGVWRFHNNTRVGIVGQFWIGQHEHLASMPYLLVKFPTHHERGRLKRRALSATHHGIANAKLVYFSPPLVQNSSVFSQVADELVVLFAQCLIPDGVGFFFGQSHRAIGGFHFQGDVTGTQDCHGSPIFESEQIVGVRRGILGLLVARVVLAKPLVHIGKSAHFALASRATFSISRRNSSIHPLVLAMVSIPNPLNFCSNRFTDSSIAAVTSSGRSVGVFFSGVGV